MTGSKRVAARDVVRTVRLVAEELPGGWSVAVWWYGHDEEGDSHEGDHLTATVQIPWVDTDLDQAWLVLMTGLHMLEAAGPTDASVRTWRSPLEQQ
jgi:hypothetical protein